MAHKMGGGVAGENAGDPLDNLDTYPKEVLSKIRSSFNDLVIYNDQGQPTIDINKLVYKPNKKKYEKEKENLRWYLPDYIFCIFNFLSLTYSTYYFLNGLTIISWRNSMQSFYIGNCSEDDPGIHLVCDTIKEQYEEESEEWNPYTIIRFYGPKDVSIHGLGLLICGIVNLLNIILAIHACINGSRSLLVTHLTIDVILFICEVFLVTLLKITGRCDTKDREIIKAFLERYLAHYAMQVNEEVLSELSAKYMKDMIKRDMIEFDLLQVSLTCCGVGNWTDYLPRSVWLKDPYGEGEGEGEGEGIIDDDDVTERFNLDMTDLVIPSTCCRQWWVRNIYCAHEAHMWAYPTVTDLQAHQFRQRISQWGCLPKLVRLCENMVVMAGMGGIVAWAIHFFLSIARHISAIFQIQTIDTLVLERKRIFRHKEKDFGDQVTDDMMGAEDGSVFPSLSTLFNEFSESALGKRSQLPHPPTEKEIAVLKSRKDFIRMRDAIKNTHLEGWISTGQAFVEGNQKPSGPLSEKGSAEKMLKEYRDEKDIRLGRTKKVAKENPALVKNNPSK